MAKPRKSYALWITGHILHALFALLIFGICGLLCWRVFISGIVPGDMKRLAPNDGLAAVYAASGEDLALYTQEQTTVTRGENNYGYFGITRCTFIPDAHQVQVVLRYNNSTLKHMVTDFSLAEQPPKGVEIFDVTLLKVVDLTPEDLTDNVDGSETLAEIRVAPSAPVIDTTALYTYCRYTFDGVDMTEDTLAAFLDIYYEEAVDYAADPYGTLRLYHRDSPDIAQELTSKEIKALENYGK